MNISIIGASTLKHFTDAILPGFASIGVTSSNHKPFDFYLIQIHGSPASRHEDQQILESAHLLNAPKAFLVHRPDELLGDPILKSYFEQNPFSKFIFLGDLVFREPFWSMRRPYCKIVPHPNLDLSLPPSHTKPIVGAFTSWGEMRDVRHYFSLAECLLDTNAFDFVIGGSGLDGVQIPSGIARRIDPFIPHFNVQLYHLHGKKRYGESSGSLHRGISIPIIFEANGAERLEGFKAVKIEADDDLKLINFTKAAKELLELTANGIDPILEKNLRMANKNSIKAFAKAVLSFLVS